MIDRRARRRNRAERHESVRHFVGAGTLCMAAARVVGSLAVGNAGHAAASYFHGASLNRKYLRRY